MRINKRTLLYDEPPIAISPTLCRLISLQAAVLLQQLHYWLQQKAASPERYKDHFIGGRYWVYWTQAELQKAVPLGRSVDPHKRLIKELSTQGVLLVAQHRASTWDRTNFYSIDYECFDSFIMKRLEDNDSEISRDPADREEGLEQVEAEELEASINVISTDDKCTESTTETSSKKTTTVVVDSDINYKAIQLLPCAERYRALIERSVLGLQSVLVQDIADEISGTIQAIELKKRIPINGFTGWIPALVKRANAGSLVAQYGPDVALARTAAELRLRDAQEIERKAEVAKAQKLQDITAAMLTLESLSESTLAWAAKSIAERFLIPSRRAGIADEILARKLPAGPGRAEAIDVLKCLKSNGGGGS